MTTAALRAPDRSEGRSDTGGDTGSLADAAGLSMAGGWGTDRHSAGVTLVAEKRDPDHGPRGHRSGCYDPSDPRIGILPRGRGGWPDGDDSLQE